MCTVNEIIVNIKIVMCTVNEIILNINIVMCTVNDILAPSIAGLMCSLIMHLSFFKKSVSTLILLLSI